MNRTILIVICDFLLVNLVAFSSLDINKIADDTRSASSTPRLEMVTNSPAEDASRDLAGVMRVALDEERRSRDLLVSELARARDTVGQQQSRLEQRDQEIREFRERVQAKEQEAARLLEQQMALSQQYASARTNIQELAENLKNTSLQALVSNERLAAMEAELKKQQQTAANLEKQIGTLQQSNQVVLNERQKLSTQLQVAEVEKRQAAQQVAQIQQQVKYEREEKARLAEGVKALASQSQELTQEIRENRPLAPNTIFFDVLTNKLQARFNASRVGTFGLDASKQRSAETVAFVQGTNAYAICHIDDTPFTLWNPGIDWEGLTGSLAANLAQVPIRAVSFYRRDPRLVLIPLSAADTKRLGIKPYSLSTEPFKFQDAVLVGVRENYYGECRFQIDVTTPDYVKLDNSFIKGLFGKFNPSRGDLVFSKTGQLLGIMANKNYCLLVQNLNTSATIPFSPDVRAQRTGRTLAQLYGIVEQMPLKLQ